MKSFDRDRFGQNIYDAIYARGLRVKDVADYMDVSVQAVHGWLDGSKLPKMDKLVMLVDLLALEMDDILPSVNVEWKGATLNGDENEKRLQEGAIQER